jgi:ATP-dependent Clp protease ATP-binding subunit ClpX
MKQRHVRCSFCRKGSQDVGPLVEGPDNVYICGDCVELCESIIEQEKRRRNPVDTSSTGADAILERLNEIVAGHKEAKAALAHAATRRPKGVAHVLLVGAVASSKLLLARALAHVLDVPFAASDALERLAATQGSDEAPSLFHKLLDACEFDLQAAQRGIVYVDGVERQETQEALLRLWHGKIKNPLGRLEFDAQRTMFVCGGNFADLDTAAARLGRHAEQPLDADLLITVGVRPDLVSRFSGIARAAPLEEENLLRIIHAVDFSRIQLNRPDAAPHS